MFPDHPLGWAIGLTVIALMILLTLYADQLGDGNVGAEE
jgi:hypothetical protein